MELAEIVGLRPVPCAGLLVTVTRRCPLRCAHCSTSSTMQREQIAGGPLLRFMRTLTAQSRPRLVLFTGGEPLLRPGLVSDLAGAARAAGSATAVLTGGFFARGGALPDPIRRVVSLLDHVSVSLDAFHEREVARADVFTLLRRLLDLGVAVSLHVVGTDGADPYLADVTGDVRRTFGGVVPMLVGEVQAVGRASAWSAAVARASGSSTGTGTDAGASAGAGTSMVSPCTMAAWPVVGFDGTVTACCNQDVVDGVDLPEHLRLGHIGTDDWATLAARSLASPTLRLVRAAGPEYVHDTYLGPGSAGRDAGYCGSCRALGSAPALTERIGFAAGPVGALLDREAARLQVAAGPAEFVRRHGCARYADLVLSPQRAAAVTADPAVAADTTHNVRGAP